MTNYKLTISYDGSNYHGWEAKPTTPLTIQGTIENVLSTIDNAPAKLIGAGRTDAGVHAKAMIANAHLNINISPKELLKQINLQLPPDIRITNACTASNNFHSRYNATGKTYSYTCYIGESKPVFLRRYVYPFSKPLDLKRMRKAADFLIGFHDFRSFCGNSKSKKSTIREIYSIDIVKNGDYLTFTYHGNGFLQYMIRILTGTLLEVGYGNIAPEHIPEIIASKDRSCAGFTAPPAGLCLIKVDYN